MEVVCTPRRTKRPVDRRAIAERRKSLFGACGVSPLSSPDQRDSDCAVCASPSWSDESPRKTAASPRRTPLKAITPVKSLQNDFTQMALTRTPENKTPPCAIVSATPPSAKRRIGSAGVRRSPRVAGIHTLPPDRGFITPQTFYGKKSMEFCHSDGREMYQRIRQSVRVRLPMETFPRESKKRARSGGSSASNSVKRRKKLPRYRLFEEDEQKKKRSPKTAKETKKTPRVSGTDIGEELTLIRESASEKKVSKKKQTYNWQFFNSKTPPARKMSKLFSERSPSVLTPPPTIRKRKLISSFDMDHLQDDKENSSLISNAQKVKSELDGLDEVARGIWEDFSEEEDEEDLKEKCVDEILEDLNKDVAEVLGENAVKEAVNDVSPSVNKLFPVFTNAATPKSSEKKLSITPLAEKKRKVDSNQLILDVGQRALREIECSQCGLLYVNGDDTDEEFHRRHHARTMFLHINTWWKGIRFVADNHRYRIILVRTGDSKSAWQQARSVLEVVDQELGYPSEDCSPSQVYLYVKKKQVVGCLAARRLEKAHRLLPSLDLDMELCSEEEYPVRAGVSRLWVANGHRREGIAKTLVDYLRRNFTYGEILSSSDVAFSSPTEDGKKFAINYFGREDFLIYTFAPSY